MSQISQTRLAVQLMYSITALEEGLLEAPGPLSMLLLSLKMQVWKISFAFFQPHRSGLEKTIVCMISILG